MTFEELQDLLAVQFSCDTGDMRRGTALADLGADHEDMIELAWALGEAIGEEIDESELSEDFTIGELWRFVRDKVENAQEYNKRRACLLRQAFLVCKQDGRGRACPARGIKIATRLRVHKARLRAGHARPLRPF